MTEERLEVIEKKKIHNWGLITKFVDQDDFISVIDFGFVDKFDSDYPEGFPGTPDILPFKKGHSLPPNIMIYGVLVLSFINY